MNTSAQTTPSQPPSVITEPSGVITDRSHLQRARIVFMGTAEFGVPALRLIHEHHDVVAVVTVPDKAAGRGLQLRESAVKIAARECGITRILQPASLNDASFIEELRSLEADIYCVIAFRILPRAVYTLARMAAFNVHASLLPRFRGAAPINHAIMSGDRESGVTSFLLNDVVDTGTILLQSSTPISENMTAGELYAALMPLGADLALRTIDGLCTSSIVPHMQDDALASPAPKVWREQCGVNWAQSAETVRHFIHGVSPTPAAWTTFAGQRLKIYRVRASTKNLAPGSWVIEESGWTVGCASGSIELLSIQLPGKSVTQVSDFIRGYRGERRGVFE